MVKYLKENFFVRYRRFDSFAQVNQLLEQWMADVADRRELRQFRQTPEQRFTQEQEHLQPLPDTDFDTSYFDIRHVSWDGYIEVGGNRYSVPESLCGQPVSIRISLDDELRIYSNEQQMASHRLCSATLIVDILPALKGGEDVNNSRPHHDVILTDRCQKQRIHPILYLPYNT